MQVMQIIKTYKHHSRAEATVSLSLSLSPFLSQSLSISVSLCLSVCLSLSVSLCLSVCLSLSVSLCLSLCLCVCLCLYVSIPFLSFPSFSLLPTFSVLVLRFFTLSFGNLNFCLSFSFSFNVRVLIYERRIIGVRTIFHKTFVSTLLLHFYYFHSI